MTTFTYKDSSDTTWKNSADGFDWRDYAPVEEVTAVDTPEVIIALTAETDLQVRAATPEATIQTVVDAPVVVLGQSVSQPEVTIALAAETDLQVDASQPEAIIVLSAATGVVLGQAVSQPEATIQTVVDAPVVVLGQAVSQPEAIIVLAAETGIVVNYRLQQPEAIIVLAAETDALMSISQPEAIIVLTGYTGSVFEFGIEKAIIRYFLIITGDQDSTTDVEIPMTSFQARRRTGENTFLSAVIPSIDYITQIEDRPNGNMVIEQGYELNGAVVQRETIITTSIDELNYDEGAVRKPITLVGYKQTTFTSKSVTLTGSTYRSMRSGVLRHRLSEPYIFLNPGDVVTIGTDVFTIDLMSYVISPTTAVIELAAA